MSDRRAGAALLIVAMILGSLGWAMLVVSDHWDRGQRENLERQLAEVSELADAQSRTIERQQREFRDAASGWEQSLQREEVLRADARRRGGCL